MNVFMGESSFIGCRLVPWQAEEGRGLLGYPRGTSDTECYTRSKDFTNPEITLLKHCSINPKPNSEAEGG